jgi:hypothetical protein
MSFTYYGADPPVKPSMKSPSAAAISSAALSLLAVFALINV